MSKFDAHIKNTFDQHKLSFVEDHWDLMQARMALPEQTRVRNHWWKIHGMSIASAAVLLFFIGIWTLILNNTVERESIEIPLSHAQKEEKRQINALTGFDYLNDQESHSLTKLVHNFGQGNSLTKYLKTPNLSPSVHKVAPLKASPLLTAAILEQEINEAIALQQARLPNIFNSYNFEQGLTFEQQFKNVPINKTNPLKFDRLPSSKILDDPYYNNSLRKTAYNVMGGIGYNQSQNASFIVGVGAQTLLSKRLFIENALSIGSTKEATAFNYINNNIPGQFAARGPIDEHVNLDGQLYYVSYSPSIGLQLTKFMSVAGGGDVQRFVVNSVQSNNSSALSDLYPNYTPESIKMRSWDAGISGKVSFIITPELNLSFQYRHGLVNLLPQFEDIESYRRHYGTLSIQYQLNQFKKASAK